MCDRHSVVCPWGSYVPPSQSWYATGTHRLKEPLLAVGEDAELVGKCLSMLAGASEPHTTVGLNSPTNSISFSLNCSPAKLFLI